MTRINHHLELRWQAAQQVAGTVAAVLLLIPGVCLHGQHHGQQAHSLAAVLVLAAVAKATR